MVRRTLLSSAIVLLSAAAVHGGDLKMRFQFAGDVPAPQPINVTKDAQFCGKHNLTEPRLLVNPENKGIKNVVVYVYTGRGGSDLPPQQPKNNKHTLANKNCEFVPHIITAQVGDTLEVTNPDPVGHNANLNFLKNTAQNFTIPAGGAKEVQLQQDEPAPIPVECNIHPWMKAYVVVLEHPFVGVSDKDGNLVIKGLPEGEELTFRVFHEAATGAIEEVSVNGKQQEWSRNRFDVKIGAGENDYGTVTLTGEQLK